MVLFFGADDVRLLSGKHPSRMIRRVALDFFICALAENSPRSVSDKEGLM